VLHRGLFGTNITGSNPIDRYIRNVWADAGSKNLGNTHQFLWGGKLLALWEGGRATALDPYSLDYQGEESFKGSISSPSVDASAQWLKLEQTFKHGAFTYSAHPRIDEKRGHVVNFGLRLDYVCPQFCVWEHDRDMNLVSQQIINTEGYPESIPIVHSIGVSENWIVIHSGPVQADPVKGLTARFSYPTKGIDEVRICLCASTLVCSTFRS
jgi:carotenoid cleavage dioxygenase-like enzyme